MKRQLKKIIQSGIKFILYVSSKTILGRYIQSQFVSISMEQTTEVVYNGVVLKFSVPNKLCHWRAETFASKEPETLEWIDSLSAGSILWDIGANIGLYAAYAAKSRNCKVWAFEPSVFNLELLARNIYLNQIIDKVSIVPVALSNQLGLSHMRMTSTEWGGALSTFGHDFGWDGKPIEQIFEYQTFGLSMEDAINKLALPMPDYIKMDVDGIEHIILDGGLNVLKNVKEILLEINDDFHEQADQCEAILKKAGLVLREKRHSEIISLDTTGFSNTYNQIWSRK